MKSVICLAGVACLLTTQVVGQDGAGLPRARAEEVGLSASALERIGPALKAYADYAAVAR